MTGQQRESWKKARAIGRGNFILKEGVWRRGVPFGLFVTGIHMLLSVFMDGSAVDLRVQVIRMAFLTLGFGLAMGLHLWQSNESEFGKPME